MSFPVAPVPHPLRPLLLLAALGGLLPQVASAQTTFSLSSTAANYATGSLAPDGGTGEGGVFSNGSSYSSTGSTTNNLTPLTFGQTFYAEANGTSTQGGTAAWLYDGTVAGTSIASGTTMPVFYDFTVDKNFGIDSDVTWTLYLRIGSSADVMLASDVLSGFGNVSANYSGSATYSFTSGVSGGDTFRSYIEVASATNISIQQGVINVTMVDTGFGGQGITLNFAGSAVPEPSTYAAFAGVAILGFAGWRRRGRRTFGAAA